MRGNQDFMAAHNATTIQSASNWKALKVAASKARNTKPCQPFARQSVLPARSATWLGTSMSRQAENPTLDVVSIGHICNNHLAGQVGIFPDPPVAVQAGDWSILRLDSSPPGLLLQRLVACSSSSWRGFR
jgi:hypothetical protein